MQYHTEKAKHRHSIKPSRETLPLQRENGNFRHHDETTNHLLHDRLTENRKEHTLPNTRRVKPNQTKGTLLSKPIGIQQNQDETKVKVGIKNTFRPSTLTAGTKTTCPKDMAEPMCACDQSQNLRSQSCLRNSRRPYRTWLHRLCAGLDKPDQTTDETELCKFFTKTENIKRKETGNQRLKQIYQRLLFQRPIKKHLPIKGNIIDQSNRS